MTKISKTELKKIFAPSVDGANCNAYWQIEAGLKKQFAKNPSAQIEVKDLMKVVGELSNKWEREIDKYIS